MELRSWKSKYPEDVQGYVNLYSNSIPLKADIDYTGMFKNIIFPMDTRSVVISSGLGVLAF